MRGHTLTVVLILAMALLPAPGAAAQDMSDDEFMDSMVSQVLKTNFLTLACQLPSIQPKVTDLKRNWSPDLDQLIKLYFGKREAVMGEQSLDKHMIWGRGRRFKSGTVLYLMGKDLMVPQNIAAVAREVEVVPSFLDVYNAGYEYVNNIGHTAVHATHVKKISATEADVTYYDVFSIEEGQAVAERLIAEMHGELEISEDFRIKKIPMIQDFSERLFVFKANPEYLTEYNLYGEVDLTKSLDNRQPVGAQPLAIEVWDVYTTVMLDGDKLLASIAYYWDAGLKVEGHPVECNYAGSAMLAARDYLLDIYNGEPPLLTVDKVTIGFIQDPTRAKYLIPVWFFSAWHVQTVTIEESGIKVVSPITSPYARNVVKIPYPFAVNALTNEVYVLDKTQLP